MSDVESQTLGPMCAPPITRKPMIFRFCGDDLILPPLVTQTPRAPKEMLLERTLLAIHCGVSRRLRQMIQLMPQLSFLSSVEDSCSGSKSSSAIACDASPCAPVY